LEDLVCYLEPNKINFNRLKTMNKLDVTKEIKQVTYTYTSDNLTFEGTCNVDSKKVVSDVNAQVSVKQGEAPMNIGSVSSNSSTSINIWNSEYKSLIDTVATAFKSLQTDLTNYYNVQSVSDTL
jgi:hypothetical protein